MTKNALEQTSILISAGGTPGLSFLLNEFTPADANHFNPAK